MAKILIVDDDDRCRTALRSALRSHGHEVTEAQDGHTAIKRFYAERPALVLLDVLMPEKDGIETLAAIRNSQQAVPVIAMSGGGLLRSEFLLRMMMELGATECLAKPFSPDDLAAAVARQLHPSSPPAPSPYTPGAPSQTSGPRPPTQPAFPIHP